MSRTSTPDYDLVDNFMDTYPEVRSVMWDDDGANLRVYLKDDSDFTSIPEDAQIRVDFDRLSQDIKALQLPVKGGMVNYSDVPCKNCSSPLFIDGEEQDGVFLSVGQGAKNPVWYCDACSRCPSCNEMCLVHILGENADCCCEENCHNGK